MILILYGQNLLTFQTNDDFGIIMLSNGAISGKLEKNLWFIEIPYGFLLYLLNSILDTLPWYGLIQYILLAASAGLYVKLIFILAKDLKKQIYLFIPVIFIIYCTISLQFTQTAAISVTVGLGTFLILIKKLDNLISLIVFILGFLLRFEVALISVVLVFFTYLFISYLMKKQDSEQEVQKIFSSKKIVIILLLFILISTVHYLTRNPNSPFISAQNKEFINYNLVRGNIHGWDYAYINSTQENIIRKEVGWSKNDLKLFKTFFYQDSVVYDFNKVQKYSNLYNINIYSLNNNLFNFKEFWINFVLANYVIFLIIIFYFLIIIYQNNLKLINYMPFLFFSIGILYIISLMSSMSLRLFNSFSFIFLFCVTLFLFLDTSSMSKKFITLYNKKFTNSVVSFVILVSYFLNFFNIYQVINTRKINLNVCKNFEYDKLVEFKYNKPIIAFPSFTTELSKCISPLNNYKKNYNFWKKVIPIGWALKSPQLNHKIMKFNLNNDLIDNLPEGKVFIGIANNIELQMISQFAIEHKEFNVNWPPAPFAYSDNNLQVWNSIK